MLTLASELRSRYRVSFVCPPTAEGMPFLERAARLGVETLGLEARFNTPALSDLYEWVCSQDIDIFHCHAGITWEGFGGIEVAHQASVPVVLRTEHLPYLLTHPVQRMDHRRMVEQVDCIICVSEASCTSFMAAGVPAQKLRIVRNGVSIRPPQAGRAATLSSLGISPKSDVVITVGRLAPQKGHHLLVDSLPDVLQSCPNTHFLWVGEGPLGPELAERLRGEGLDSRVHMLNKRTDIPDLLGAANVFVLPSYFEGLPLSVLEAMSAGLPVVGTRVPGTSEAVVDGVTGRLVEAGDARGLADAIIEVLRDPDLAKERGAAGRTRVSEHFSAASMCRQVYGIYADLLDNALQLEPLQSMNVTQPDGMEAAI